MSKQITFEDFENVFKKNSKYKYSKYAISLLSSLQDNAPTIISSVKNGKKQVDKISDISLHYSTNFELSSNLNVLYEITLGKKIKDMPKNEVSKLYEILSGLKLTNLCNGTDENIFKLLSKKKFNEFSSGEKQRLALAKILFLLGSNHYILLFDEPTANLDEKIARSVLDFISNFAQKDMKRLVIISSHHVRIASEISDKIFEIRDGILTQTK